MSAAAEQPRPPAAGPFAWRHHSWGWVLECEPIARVAVHGFTTRPLAFKGETTRCEAEWRLLAESAGVRPDAVAAVDQVHGARIVHGAAPASVHRTRADGLVSRDPSILLTIRVADCVPILIVDRRRGAVAAVHAGWRGTAADIAGAAVRQLHESCGCSPVDLMAALGPSIGPCCYSVGPELMPVFEGAGHRSVPTWFWRRDETLRLDLWSANRDQLVAAGVATDAVFVSGLCTACHPRWFYSYRREGATAGRLVAFIRAPDTGGGADRPV